MRLRGGPGLRVPARVFNAVSLADDREILSVAFVAIELRAMHRLATEHDLTGDPREVEIGSAESLLRGLLAVS